MTLKKLALVLSLGMQGLLPAHVASEPLQGSWSLKEFTIVSRSGDEAPFCEGATGLIIYEKSGYMSVSINCATPVSPTAPAAAYNGHLFYAGAYREVGRSVTHIISSSSSPSLIGKKLVRTAETITQDELVLTGA